MNTNPENNKNFVVLDGLFQFSLVKFNFKVVVFSSLSETKRGETYSV